MVRQGHLGCQQVLGCLLASTRVCKDFLSRTLRVFLSPIRTIATLVQPRKDAESQPPGSPKVIT